MLLKYEIKKLLGNHAFYIMLVFLLISVLLFMYMEGYWEHDFCVRTDEFSCKDNQLITGQEAYNYNKSLADSYKGIVSNALLAKLHEEYKSDPKIESHGVTYYDSTYEYFKSVFRINEDDYLKVEDAYSCNGVRYGFTGDWFSLIGVLDRFFFVFFIAVIVFVSPVFAIEHEKGIAGLLSTTYGGRHDLFLKCKLKVVLLCINTILFAFLIVITGVHFLQCGFAGHDISIQSNVKYWYSMLDMNLGQFVIYKVAAGILGSNLICLIMILISMHGRETFQCVMAGIIGIGIFNRNIILRFIGINLVDYILAFAPVNSYRLTIAAIVPDMMYVYAVLAAYIVSAFFLLYRIKRYWHTKRFYKMR